MQPNGLYAGGNMIESPFKYLEPDAECPEHLKTELVSEIDMIRNALQVVKLYAGDLLSVLSVVASLPNHTQEDTIL